MPFTTFGQNIPVTGPNIGFPGNVSRGAGADRVIVARPVNSAATNNLNFGEIAVEVSDSTGGTWRSLKDFIAASVANVSNAVAQFAGIAVRNVKTTLTFAGSVAPGTLLTGYYAAGEMAEVLERGSVPVIVTYGTPQANQPVYGRIVANASLTGTAVGDIEAAADTVSTTGTATSGSTALTVASGTGLAVGQLVTGAGIAAGTYLASGSGTSWVLSAATTADLSTTALVFANTIQLPNVVFRTGVLDANNVAEITLKSRQAA